MRQRPGAGVDPQPQRGDVLPNLTAVAVGPDGRLRLFESGGEARLLFDVAGWFAP